MTTARKLEYSVDEHGLVGTHGKYVEITEQEWDRSRNRAPSRYRPYDAVLRAMSENRIVRMPCQSRLAAIGVRATLRKRARAAGLSIDDKVVLVATEPEQWALLARRVEV